jgi:hypothetical protein
MIRTISILVAALALGSAASRASGQSCGSWEVVPSPNPPAAQNAIIRDITNIAPDDAWAVGDWWGTVNGVVQNFAMTMHWDGTKWSLVPTPQPAPCADCRNLALYGVDALGPTTSGPLAARPSRPRRIRRHAHPRHALERLGMASDGHTRPSRGLRRSDLESDGACA